MPEHGGAAADSAASPALGFHVIRRPLSEVCVGVDAVGVGNALMDALVRIDDDGLLERLGLTRGQMSPVDDAGWRHVYERVKHLGVEHHAGGSCANTISTLGVLGAQVLYRGQIGDDGFGHAYRDSLEAACGASALRVEPSLSTGKCLALISHQDAERTMLTDLGAAVQMSGVGDFRRHIESARLLHLEGYLFLGGPTRETAFEAVEIAEAADVPISLDVADPFVARTIPDDLRALIQDHATVCFLNREEAEVVTGHGAHAAVKILGEWAPWAVVKLGGEGSLVAHGGHVIHVPAVPTTVRDTTGAGDSYAGGFLYGWLQGWPAARCGHLGSHIASLTVAQIGAVVRDRAAAAAARATAEIA